MVTENRILNSINLSIFKLHEVHSSVRACILTSKNQSVSHRENVNNFRAKNSGHKSIFFDLVSCIFFFILVRLLSVSEVAYFHVSASVSNQMIFSSSLSVASRSKFSLSVRQECDDVVARHTQHIPKTIYFLRCASLLLSQQMSTQFFGSVTKLRCRAHREQCESMRIFIHTKSKGFYCAAHSIWSDHGCRHRVCWTSVASRKAKFVRPSFSVDCWVVVFHFRYGTHRLGCREPKIDYLFIHITTHLCARWSVCRCD